MRDNPVFTVADGLFWLYQTAERNPIVRMFQIMKLWGQASVPGLHYLSHHRVRIASFLAYPWTDQSKE